MPDIREVLNALDEQDKTLWRQHRTEMRRSYMAAHNTVNGVVNWTERDDAFIDLIDIQLALLFDRAGRLNAAKDIVGADSEKITEGILKQEDAVKEAFKTKISAATKSMQNEWQTK